jgi:predicted alpha/beta hydrolase
MDASPHRCSFAFFLDVVAAISDEGPSMAIGHHVGAQVAAIGAAKCEGAAVAIEGPRFAGNVAVTDEGAQMLGGGPSGRPVVGTRLARLGRVDSP